jgi:hypothetical protein
VNIATSADYERTAARLYPGADPNNFSAAQIDRIVVETRAEFEQTTGPQRTSDPRKAEPVKVDDLELEVAILTRDGAMTEQEAFRELAAGHRPTQAALNAARAELQAHADAEQARRYDASPDGRKEAALQLLADQKAEAELVEGGRALLKASANYTPEMIDRLSDREALHYSGLRPDEQLMSHRERDAQIDTPEANAEARERSRKEAADRRAVEEGTNQ